MLGSGSGETKQRLCRELVRSVQKVAVDSRVGPRARRDARRAGSVVGTETLTGPMHPLLSIELNTWAQPSRGRQ